MALESSQNYAFGTFRIDRSERELSRDGVAVPLPPKVFDVLLVLVENHGHIVRKDEMMKQVWSDTFVEDANLTVNISALRKVLGEDTNGLQFIETIPRRGYRFIASVVELSTEQLENASALDERQANTEPQFAAALQTENGEKRDPDTADRDELEIEGPRSSSFFGSIARHKRIAALATLSFAILVSALIVEYRRMNASQPSSAAVVSPISSIAVLPFENGVQDPNAEYLSDGITESLINRLSQLSGLKVASRSSSFRYKGRDQDTSKIGGELNVSAVLTGSVKQIGDELVIAVSLDEVLTNRHIWGEQYVRKFKDILNVQNEIAQDVTSNLRLKLTGADEQKLTKKYTQNTEAYQLYLKGNYEWNKHTQENIQKAIQFYEQALEKDPNFALAYAGLSGSYGLLANVYLPPNENFPKAKAYAAKALEIDDTLAEAHGAMGAVRLFYDWDWVEQEKEFKRAQALAPSYGPAHQLNAAYLESAGRFDEARLEAKKAQEIDPLLAMFGSEVGFTYYFARQYDEAIAQFEKTLNLEPSYVDAYQYLGQSYEQKKMYSQAITTFQKGMAKGERSPALIASLGHACALSGDHSCAAKALTELRDHSKQHYTSPYFFAVVYSGLDDKDQAVAWLEKAFRDRTSLLIWLTVEPQFDSLRTDPRFQDLLGRIGLNK